VNQGKKNKGFEEGLMILSHLCFVNFVCYSHYNNNYRHRTKTRLPSSWKTDPSFVTHKSTARWCRSVSRGHDSRYSVALRLVGVKVSK